MDQNSNNPRDNIFDFQSSNALENSFEKSRKMSAEEVFSEVGGKVDDQDRKKDGRKKIFIIGGVVVLFGMLFGDIPSLLQQQREIDLYASQQQFRLPQGDLLYGVDWRNSQEEVYVNHPTPQLSFFERMFCKGYKVSIFCDSTPKHPHFEHLKEYGVSAPSVERQRRYQRSTKLR